METINDRLTLMVRMAHMADGEVLCSEQQTALCTCGHAAKDQRVSSYVIQYVEQLRLAEKFLLFSDSDAYLRYILSRYDVEKIHAFCVGCGVIATQDRIDQTAMFRIGERHVPVIPQSTPRAKAPYI